MVQKDREFVHLHVHTDYSLLDGCARVDRLCESAASMGMKALAITDHGNLFGLASFFQTAKKHGIKPLLGCEVYLVYNYKRTERPEKGQAKYHHMGLIARNAQGYRNLMKLVSDAHMNGFYYKPRTDMEMLAAHAEGLIGFTGCLQGVVPQCLLRDDMPAAREAMGRFVEIFGRENYFVELQDHGLAEQRKIIPGLLKLAEEFRLKVICSNDVHYVKNTDWEPHDALVCIQTGAKVSDEKRLRYSSHQFYLKSREEMALVFGENPDWLTNTCQVAEMCDLSLPFGENHYPVFQPIEELRAVFKDNFAYIHQLCEEGLKERYGVDYQDLKSAQDPEFANMLAKRMDYELSIIQKTGFIDYFLIVWDFIDWARKQGIAVGPGRGSGAGCIVAYLLKITDIDPIRFGLLFERFLNPERVSPPDFDIDFCMRRRGEVIDYVRGKYGKESVANIITFGTFGAKMVLRDLARVLDLPYAEGDRLAKMVPDDIGISLEDAVAKSAELKDEVRRNPIAAKILEEGRVIEGMVRNTGTHAAGVIIGDRPLTELIPITVQEGALTTQYPKEPVEELGLLKMDFLGLKTLTIIGDAEANIRRLHQLDDFNISKVSFEDEPTFCLLNEAKTIGVFQLESGGMQALCRQFNISSIDEIVALIALYRPGPMEWIPDYIKGKKDPSTIQFPHPLLEDICRETYGVMVYQEQVMEAARLIAGYTLGGADILRRAMGKKKPEEMERQRTIFIKGAKTTNDIPAAKAEAIFNILEKFAGYGFNKSHSAAYAILAYQTAYLKANYPVEFMSAILSNELGNADKVAHFIEECAAMQIPVLGPDINRSLEAFTPILQADGARGSIRFGLGAIKGVGDVAANSILQERSTRGVFQDIFDFAARVDHRVVNKRVLEALIKSGAFDVFGFDRQHLLVSIDSIMAEAASQEKDRAAGQTSLFDLMEAGEENSPAIRIEIDTRAPLLPLSIKLQYEKELLGFYVSGHPMDAYMGLAEAVNSLKKNQDLSLIADRTPFRLAGVVLNLQKRLSKKDNRPWAMFTLATREGSYAMNLYSDAFERYGQELEEGKTVLVTGIIHVNEGELRFNSTGISGLDLSLPGLIKELVFHLSTDSKAEAFLKLLADYLMNHEGPTKVQLAFPINSDEALLAQIAPSLSLRIEPSIFQKWRQEPAVHAIELRVADLEKPEAPRYRKKSNFAE